LRHWLAVAAAVLGVHLLVAPLVAVGGAIELALRDRTWPRDPLTDFGALLFEVWGYGSPFALFLLAPAYTALERARRASWPSALVVGLAASLALWAVTRWPLQTAFTVGVLVASGTHLLRVWRSAIEARLGARGITNDVRLAIASWLRVSVLGLSVLFAAVIAFNLYVGLLPLESADGLELERFLWFLGLLSGTPLVVFFGAPVYTFLLHARWPRLPWIVLIALVPGVLFRVMGDEIVGRIVSTIALGFGLALALGTHFAHDWLCPREPRNA